MNGWLIYNEENKAQNESYIEWFQYEAIQQGIQLELVLREQLSIGLVEGKYEIQINGTRKTLPDFIVNRTIDPLLQQLFLQLKIRTFNNYSIAEICNHKSKTHIELNKLHIPMVPTFFIRKDAPPSQLPLSFPFVVKDAIGRSGKQIFYCRTEDDWNNALHVMDSNDLLIQSADVQLGKDVRVFVIGNEIIEAVLRVNDNDFRANFKLGGKAVPYELTASEKKMIQKISDHFDFGLVGIDFLIGHDGQLLFNEIEDVVGSRILSEVSDINLLEKYVSFIKKQILME